MPSDPTRTITILWQDIVFCRANERLLSTVPKARLNGSKLVGCCRFDFSKCDPTRDHILVSNPRGSVVCRETASTLAYTINSGNSASTVPQTCQ
jgi:hypothetical protein